MSPAMEIAWKQGSGSAEMERLLQGVGFGALDGMGWIRVTGADRVRWLNGMVTNSIQELGPGDGSYSFVLNAQGRIQGDLWAFVGDGDDLLVETSRDRVTGLIGLLDRFIIMDEVELEDVSDGRVGFAVAGPTALELLKRIGLEAGPGARRVVEWQGGRVEVIAGYSPLVARFELWTGREMAGALREALAEDAAELGGGAVGDEAFEWLRVLEGTPRFGVDIREKDLPQETMQGRALHFAKGCYLGQEIVERIRSRGNVHRGFGGFRLDGPMPEAGAVLEAGGKAVGELTSVARIPLRGEIVQLGLGYARREAVGAGARLEYATEHGAGWAVPLGLPVRLDAIVPEHLGITGMERARD